LHTAPKEPHFASKNGVYLPQHLNQKNDKPGATEMVAPGLFKSECLHFEVQDDDCFAIKGAIKRGFVKA